MVTVDAASRDLEGIAAYLHDDSLTTTDENVNQDESPVVQDTSENVEGIVDNSCIDQVENAHHHKYIEHIRKMARCTMLIISINVKF